MGSQGLEELLGDVATVAEELSGESLRHRGDGAAVVGVARGGPDPQQVASVADDQVQLESEEPSHRGLASPGDALEDLVGVDHYLFLIVTIQVPLFLSIILILLD